MSYEQIQAVVGTAIVDRDFCRALLASPAKAVQGFDLTAEELGAIATIRAQTLEEFSRKLHRWLTRPQGKRRGQRKAGYDYLRLAV
ncbi:MAG: Franean1_4349 family RiPP [Dehalococcoidales bacterium]|nr:Franean1_4349 family RiPP [Dehalococcoidales bacterium]